MLDTLCVCLCAHLVVYVRGCVVGADVGLRCFFPVAIALFLEAGSLAEPGAH